MELCDVLIVGGGPAGSSCAWALTRAGLGVTVLDKAQFPRDKICAGWITPAVVDELALDLGHYRQGRVLQPITGFRTGLLGGRQLETDFGHTVSYGIRRCEFDQYLLERSGARLQLGTPLSSLRRDGPQWIVNERFAAPLVIGAGGHFCPVARQATEKVAPGEVVVLAQEVEFEMTADQQSSCLVEEEVPELFFCDDLKGYAWCFRKGNHLNIGLGREEETRLSAHVEGFLEWFVGQGRIPRGIVPRFHGHAYRLYIGSPRKLLVDRVLLIGDAAGLAYPRSGEGIRPAVESGLLAAGVIRETPIGGWDHLADRLQRKLTARFGAPQNPGGRPALIPARWRQSIARRLMGSSWFMRRIMIERWFLHKHQPPLTIDKPGIREATASESR